MKTSLCVSLALAAVLAACGAPEPAQQAKAPAAESAAAPPAAAPATQTAQGQGRVTAVDPAAGTVTLDHEAIPALEWPAMTMAFKAPGAVLEGVKVGDEVTFDVQVTPAGPEVTRIAPRA